MKPSSRRRIGTLAGVAAAAAVVAVAALPVGSAEDGIPEWARSVRVVGGAAGIRSEPSEEAEPRGAVRHGTRLPVLGRHASSERGCRAYIEVGDDAYICESEVRPDRAPPGGHAEPRVPEGRLVPFRYARVRDGGAPVWRRLEDVGGLPALIQREDFIIATRYGRREVRGVRVVRTLGGQYVPEENVRFLYPSRFEGIELTEGRDLSRIGWNIQWRTSVHARPNGRVTSRLAMLREVEVEAVEGDWVRLADGGYVAAEYVARLNPADPPEGIGPDEPWIDVHLDSQTLLAYRGATPEFATVVSSGRPYRGRETPRGSFRIWIKLATATMDDLEHPDASEQYSVQRVPWVQYFEGSKGFHAAFWHNNFGSRVSHGCVNLSPKDARRLFDFTEPRLPDGWVQIRPTEDHPGTLVRVR